MTNIYTYTDILKKYIYKLKADILKLDHPKLRKQKPKIKSKTKKKQQQQKTTTKNKKQKCKTRSIKLCKHKTN
jgi:hypothetical protein